MLNILDFISECTDCWHTAATVADILKEQGYIYIDEGDIWNLIPGGKYFTMRNMSSVIAFRVPEDMPTSFMISAAHGESPAFKIKAVPELKDKNYIRLNTEAYGGMLISSWLDRPLSVSGRVICETAEGLETRLLRLERDSLIIPSLAPHLNRDSKDINVLRDTPPLYALSDCSFLQEIAETLNVGEDKIIGFDLMLYNREEGRIWGCNNEFISAPRLDDLQCVYALLQGFIASIPTSAVQMYCVFDNEEVGSGTKQGAKSDFLPSVLRRICESLNISYSEYMRLLNSSFMVSADNGHALHPNRRDMSDSTCYPVIGGGVVIKYNASQKYTTDGVSEAIFRKICENADVPCQVYANRSDLPGGSTLGNLAAEKVCINTVDVGLAQLAMHSSFETAGTADTEAMQKAITEFYNSRIISHGGKYAIL